MKKLYFFLLLVASQTLNAQDFSKNLATAKSSYSGGDLENARFAMQQMINDLDVIIGKDILKILPPKMDAMSSNLAADNVSANTGLAGVMIHRDYGSGEKTCNIDIMSNSPIVASLNAILAVPFMGNSGDGSQKVVKVAGYKGILQKSDNSENSKTDFTLQIPLNSTLLTFSIPGSSESDVLRLANTIPIAEIAKKVQ